MILIDDVVNTGNMIGDIGNDITNISENISNVRYKTNFLMMFFSKTIEKIVVGDEYNRRYELDRRATDIELVYLAQAFNGKDSKYDIKNIFADKGTSITVSILLIDTEDKESTFCNKGYGLFRNGTRYIILLDYEFNEDTLAKLYFDILDTLILNCGILQQKIPPMTDVLLVNTSNRPLVLGAYFMILMILSNSYDMSGDMYTIFSDKVNGNWFYTRIFTQAMSIGKSFLHNTGTFIHDEFLYELATFITTIKEQ